jgi:hypothetical protein
MLNIDAFKNLLSDYPDQDRVNLVSTWFQVGAPLGYVGPREVTSVLNNNNLSREEEVAIANDIIKEMELGRMAGPFTLESIPFSNFVSSPSFAISKKNSTELRRIHNLSAQHLALENRSINDCIETSAYKNFGISDAAALFTKFGKKAHALKVDVKSAFRFIPVLPADRQLLCLSIFDKFFVEKSLPFGSRSSPALWETFIRMVLFGLRTKYGLDSVIAYVDDFLLVAGSKAACNLKKKLLLTIFKQLGIPVNLTKLETEGVPSPTVTLLGVTLDAISMSASLPREKLSTILSTIADLDISRSEWTLKEVQQLVGSLAFVCRVVPAGKIFLSRIIAALRSLSALKSIDDPNPSGVLTSEIKSDLKWWLTWLPSWPGLSLFFLSPEPVLSCSDLNLYTDACLLGFGATLIPSFTFGAWPSQYLKWFDDSATLLQLTKLPSAWLEIAAVGVAFASFGSALSRRKILLQSDNTAIVTAINKGYSGDPVIAATLRFLFYFCISHHSSLSAVYYPGAKNVLADSLSRLDLQNFRTHSLSRNLRFNLDPSPSKFPSLHNW